MSTFVPILSVICSYSIQAFLDCRIYGGHCVCWKCHWSHRYMCKCIYTQARSETDLRSSAKMQGRLNGVPAIFEVLKVLSRTNPYIIFIFPLLVLLLHHRLIDIPLVFSHISKAMFPFLVLLQWTTDNKKGPLPTEETYWPNLNFDLHVLGISSLVSSLVCIVSC